VKRGFFLSALVALPLFTAPTAHAWEAETTQAGLAEQAALSSKLHKRLVNLGFSGGLFEQLTIPPADSPSLAQDLKLLSPTHGAVPDARGRQSALAWIAAGAALADVPASHGANHFYDPDTKKGWRAPSRGVIEALSDKVREAVGRADLPDTGVPAPDWVVSKDNTFNVDAFYDQYAKAVTAKTPGERSRHMAAALIAAGAIVHTLGDLGVPSRVRGDSAAHLEHLGGGPDDLGSRFERIAALSAGRLGVPGPAREIKREHLRDFFTAPDGKGLADVIAHSYFSTNTLPRPSRVGGDSKPELARSLPSLPSRLNLMAASRDDGTTLRDKAGTCLARYKVEHGLLEFWLDDDCMLEEVSRILPEVSAYETGLLDYLLRGDLTIKINDGQILVGGKALGAGAIEILVEDNRGVRTTIVNQKVTGAPAGDEASQGTPLLKAAAPESGSKIYAVYRGVALNGEPMVATGAMPFGQN
jgi:hypothetical protein